MTKEELKDLMLEAWGQTDSVQRCIDVAIRYADQETERIKAELNELKERHKKDVEDAFFNGAGNCCGVPDIKDIDDAKQYYKQKFESND